MLFHLGNGFVIDIAQKNEPSSQNDPMLTQNDCDGNITQVAELAMNIQYAVRFYLFVVGFIWFSVICYYTAKLECD